MTHDFAELLTASNFTFLTGASHPDEMVAQARALGLAAIGLADRNSFAGMVRAHLAAKDAGIPLVVGTRLVTRCGLEIAAYPTDLDAWARLTRLLTDANFAARKGDCELHADAVASASHGQVLLIIPPCEPDQAWQDRVTSLLPTLKGETHLVLTRWFDGRDGERLHRLSRLATDWGLTTVASTDARYHAPGRKPLADVVTCIREHVRINEAGFHLAANADRHPNPPPQLSHPPHRPSHPLHPPAPTAPRPPPPPH
ncbi:PHP domain-containing protein, partial [uncultured Maricaulis sp.]|uniref:PHP domain-containing protein n=1 Tax=uncultured Maricaulis sp. TaxID=174710 RepID=UPI0030DD0A66